MLLPIVSISMPPSCSGTASCPSPAITVVVAQSGDAQLISFYDAVHQHTAAGCCVQLPWAQQPGPLPTYLFEDTVQLLCTQLS